MPIRDMHTLAPTQGKDRPNRVVFVDTETHQEQLPTGEGEGSTSESAASGELPDLPALAQAAQANSPTAVSS